MAKIAVSYAILVSVIAFVLGCRRLESVQSEVVFTGQTMGTTYTVKAVDPSGRLDGDSLGERIQARLDAVNAAMSTYREDSEVSRFNRAETTDWFEVSRETAAVVAEALRIGTRTDGAFDVTVGPVLKLWHFGAGASVSSDSLPSDAEIASAKEQTGFELVSVRMSPPALKKERPGLTLDLSGIAKGYAVDEVAAILESQGLAHYMVEIGGEVRAKGKNGHSQAWRIAVEKPVSGERSIQRVVLLHDASMATSGDYRNYFEIDGKRYSHVIDPRLGRPVSHPVVSVTVIAPNCATADALATGLMVLGSQAGYALSCEEGIPALFILKTESGFLERTTPAFERLELQK